MGVVTQAVMKLAMERNTGMNMETMGRNSSNRSLSSKPHPKFSRTKRYLRKLRIR